MATPEPQPSSCGISCSYAELAAAESLSERLSEARSEVLWRPVWLRSGRDWLAGLVAIVATALGLCATVNAIASGVALAALLILWSLEVGGLPSPLSWLCPLRATQDVIARDPRGDSVAASTLLAVRCDLHRVPQPAARAVAGRAAELTWVVIAATLGTTAARALDWPEEPVSAVQLLPALSALILLSSIVLARTAAIEQPASGWTGIEQACDAIRQLDQRAMEARRFDVVIVGATGRGGVERALRADRAAVDACRCWEYASGDDVIAALGPIG